MENESIKHPPHDPISALVEHAASQPRPSLKSTCLSCSHQTSQPNLSRARQTRTARSRFFKPLEVRRLCMTFSNGLTDSLNRPSQTLSRYRVKHAKPVVLNFIKEDNCDVSAESQILRWCHIYEGWL